jgi:hypothetical protein
MEEIMEVVSVMTRSLQDRAERGWKTRRKVESVGDGSKVEK